jgi:hypothetical protein
MRAVPMRIVVSEKTASNLSPDTSCFSPVSHGRPRVDDACSLRVFCPVRKPEKFSNMKTKKFGYSVDNFGLCA